MIFLILLLVAVVMTTATYRSVVNKQRRDWREHGRARLMNNFVHVIILDTYKYS